MKNILEWKKVKILWNKKLKNYKTNFPSKKKRNALNKRF